MNFEYIQFRAWFEEMKKMFEVYSINFDERTVYLVGLGGIAGRKLELLQYTLKNDKNYDKIYEKDILTGELGDDIKNKMVYVVYIPSKQTYELRKMNGDFYLDLNNMSTSSLEIVGNVYENPELLEKT